MIKKIMIITYSIVCTSIIHAGKPKKQPTLSSALSTQKLCKQIIKTQLKILKSTQEQIEKELELIGIETEREWHQITNIDQEAIICQEEDDDTLTYYTSSHIATLNKKTNRLTVTQYGILWEDAIAQFIFQQLNHKYHEQNIK